MLRLLENINLSHFTTMRLGGNAKYFAICTSLKDMIECLKLADSLGLRTFILGGGSNVIFPDEGFDGLVIRIDLKGMRAEDNGDSVGITLGAGEIWDNVVRFAVENSLGGIECLSGIPGSAGATPIQNVGAYGQEIRSVLISLKAVNKNSLNVVEFTNDECGFEYRQSRFKNEDRDKFIITEITLSLKKNADPEILYPELSKYIAENFNLKNESSLREKLRITRKAVLDLRRRKSMVLDERDPNTRSCGSFFLNPLISEKEFAEISSRLSGIAPPHFRTENRIKIPAAWLIEHCGFSKGFKKGGAAISSNHTLALINYGGTAREILSLAEEIEQSVFNQFGIKLHKEPVVV